MRRVAVVVVVLVALGSLAASAGATSTAPRPKAPAIAGKTVTGGRASLAKLKGKPVFVNVWSSW